MCGEGSKTSITVPVLLTLTIITLIFMIVTFMLDSYYIIETSSNHPNETSSSLPLVRYIGVAYQCLAIPRVDWENKEYYEHKCFTIESVFNCTEIVDVNGYSSTTGCKIVGDSFIIFYVSVAIHIVTFIMTITICAFRNKPEKDSCGPATLSCVASIPSWICFILLMCDVIMSGLNVPYFEKYLRESQLSGWDGEDYVYLGAAYILVIVSVFLVLPTSLLLSWYSGTAIFDCFKKESGDSYHAT
eukprot:TRINITY_DN5524_c0_g1_i1.p1 TRINITY_DN5524_c0_g1~~TRINITY_DN5524_c0_g1_i1.p1  ORF type:complete len:244 (-),score=1.32 TRINITY_DN5524_c0_g1_i1:193-924(-)